MNLQMADKLLVRVFLLIFCVAMNHPVKAQTTSPGDAILGRWTADDKSLTVDVYKEKNQYKAKMVWFKNEDNSKAMDEWTDKHNPDKALRNRKLIGMDVVKELIYEPKSNTWEHGSIYDAKSGKTWGASAMLTRDGLLKVTGYWHLKFIGRTMTFKKAS
jgi:uncharacterized protein (DUF2147 family)